MRRSRAGIVTVMLVVAFALSCVLAACSFTPAYRIESVRIDAQVQTDAAVHIVDHRLLAFDDSIGQTAVQYQQVYPHLAENQSIVLNDVRVATANAEGAVEGNWTWLSPVDFDPSWQNGIDKGRVDEFANRSVCTFDPEEARFYLFFTAPIDGLVMLEIDYTVVNGAQVYKDAGDVTYKYIGEETGVDARNVTYSISLPVPEGEQANPRKDVYAWGHGPASGSFVNAGATITYTADLVRAGQYAEAHVMFPRSWLMNATDLSARVYRDEMHASWTIEHEADWQDTWRNASINDDRMSVILSALCLLALLTAAVIVAVFRRHPNPSPTIEGETRAYADSMHPATAIRLRNEGRPSDEEFASTIARLCDENVLAVRRVSDGDSLDYRLERTSFGYVENPLDSDALSVLETLGLDESLGAGELRSRASGNREEFLDAVRMWRKDADDAYAAGGFDDLHAAAWKRRLLVCALALIFLAVFVASLSSCYLASLLLLVTGMGLCVAATGLCTLSQRGVDVLAALEMHGEPDVPCELGAQDADGVSHGELVDAVLKATPIAFDAAQKPPKTLTKRWRTRSSRAQK